jgi:uncharacterized metal-binding protein YceD (DUF177 family)
MSKFELYNIGLKDMKGEAVTYDFVLDEAYFKKIDSPEVQKGTVNAKVIVTKKPVGFELAFSLNGVVKIPCDRCLDDMDQAIDYKEKLYAKFGNQFAEEDEVVIIPENEGSINIAWFMYEFIVINIPIKHVHAPGECNKTMVSKLKKHITRHRDDDDTSDIEFTDDDEFSSDDQTDPRWDSLQNISENN